MQFAGAADKRDRTMTPLQKMSGRKTGANAIIGEEAWRDRPGNILVNKHDVAASIDFGHQRAVVGVVGHQQDAIYLGVIDP